MPQMYNDPAGGTKSDIGTQLRTDHLIKQALIEAKKDVFFGQLADTTAMPKNMGKKIKRYQYVPMLDDANINDQGIDTLGASTAMKVTLVVTMSDGTIPPIRRIHGIPFGKAFRFVGEGANGAAASDDVRAKVLNWAAQIAAAGGPGLTPAGADDDAKFAMIVTTGAGSAYNLGYRFKDLAGNTIATAPAMDSIGVPQFGNLYGSSKDIGAIPGKMPVLSEVGGKVNRVGFTRIELEGTLKKYGFYSDYTQESIDFDTDAELEMHINREMIFGANEITEDLLQIDLLNAAGVVLYAGGATSTGALTGAGTATVVTYGDLSRLSVELDNNRCPKTTKVISGSRMVDTRVIRGGRVMFVGSELTETLERMTDYFSAQAFIGIQHYADAGTILNGEIGSVGPFRIVVVPEMMHWAAAGANEGTNLGYRATAGKYDVFPMLVVGDGSFTTIGFQTSGNSVKFVIKHAKPGSPESYANDPYGETGFMSIKWYYGFMALRPERIGLIKTVARV